MESQLTESTTASASPAKLNGSRDGVRANKGFLLDTPTEILILVIGTIACLAPFLMKPLNIDDPLFVWSAKQIQQHPTDFYGFDVNWYGWSQPMHLVNQNPPGAAYYLALTAPLTGFHEIGMHLAFLLPNLALVLGTYVLAKRFCGRPLIATIAACGTPAVLVSATTLMCDTLMTACWCWAMVLWLAGLDRPSPLYFLAAGVLVTAAALSKYFGICVLPLLIAYSIARNRRPGWWLLGAVVPIAALTAYELWARHLYGHGLLTGAIGASVDWRQRHGGAIDWFNSLLYLGGCLLTVGCAAPWLWPPRAVIAAAVAAIAFFAIWTAAGPFSFNESRDLADIRWILPLHGVVFLLAAVNLIALVVLDPIDRRSKESLLLACWFAGTLAFVAAVNWIVTARTLVPLAPAAGILFARRLEWVQQRRGLGPRGGVLAGALGAGVAISLIVAWGDSTFASSQRVAAASLVRHFSQSSQAIWFEGHWGLQYYLEQLGAKPLDTGQTVVKGDIVILPLENASVGFQTSSVSQPVGIVEFPRARWVASVATPLRANYYGAQDCAFLPFVFGPIPPDKYLVEQIQSTVRLTPSNGADTRARDGTK